MGSYRFCIWKFSKSSFGLSTNLLDDYFYSRDLVFLINFVFVAFGPRNILFFLVFGSFFIPSIMKKLTKPQIHHVSARQHFFCLIGKFLSPEPFLSWPYLKKNGEKLGYKMKWRGTRQSNSKMFFFRTIIAEINLDCGCLLHELSTDPMTLGSVHLRFLSLFLDVK